MLLKKRSLKSILTQFIHINDNPQRIAVGFGLGVFLGVIPGTGPIAALFLAALFRLNRASALAGSIIFNSWINIATFLFAIKTGSAIMGQNWQNTHKESLFVFKSFQFNNLFKVSFIKIILPVLIGYLIIGLFLGALSYLIALIILKNNHKKTTLTGNFKK